MSRPPEFLSLSDDAARAVYGPGGRHAALIEDAFKVLIETPGGGVSLQGDARGRGQAKRGKATRAVHDRHLLVNEHQAGRHAARLIQLACSLEGRERLGVPAQPQQDGRARGAAETFQLQVAGSYPERADLLVHGGRFGQTAQRVDGTGPRA